MIKIENVHLAYRNQEVIKELSLHFTAGEFCALIGPNGAGKSTLLKSLVKFLEPKRGKIVFNGKSLADWKHKELAKNIALIPQEFQLQFDFKVRDLVLTGRFPYLGYWQNYSRRDIEIAEEVLRRLDLFSLKDKMFSQLSGGEKQRVSIARALVQETEVILMDEAFANLDVNHQLEIMQIVSKINKEQGKMIILVSHNINLASDYCERIVMLKKGKLIADGHPRDIINSVTIKELFDADFDIVENPISGRPNLVYPGKKSFTFDSFAKPEVPSQTK
ncbi:MAG: ABC transporter [Candidatus Cloacimonadota bacterium]|nr:MAG: ABC transporter [Candidatus Cloacimonadota bacterium]